MITRILAVMPRLIAALCRTLLILAFGVTAVGAAVLALRFIAISLLVFAAQAWRTVKRRAVTDNYGSAATASLSQMESGGLLGEDGLILGRCLDDRPALSAGALALLSPRIGNDLACRTFLAALFGGKWLSGRLIRVKNHIHLTTFSPAGGGKGVAALIPNLLSYKGNCVVVDPKGELFRATAQHRSGKFGHRIIRLDPFGVCGPGGDALNPYDFLFPQDDDFLDQCREFGNAIIIRESDEKYPHFNDMAELNLIGLTAYICGLETNPALRHLGSMRAIASSRQKYDDARVYMQDSDACQGVIRRLGGQMTFPAKEEQGSVLTTFSRQTNFLDSPAVARNVKTSTFDPLILRRQPADIFLILPAGRLASLSRLMRLWIDTIMRRITSGVPTEKNPVLWLLDEMAHIGHMQAIEDAVTLKRGMGMRLWFIFQSMGQLKTCFGEKAPTVLDNIGTQQYFGINSFETAEEISKRIGDTTIGIETEAYNAGDSYSTQAYNGQQSSSRSRGHTLNRSEIARRLLKPEEVLTLSPDICLIFHKHLPVCLGRLVRYFEAPEFRRGGTARARRVGIAAMIAAGFTLFAGCLFTAAALSVAPPQPGPVRPAAVGERGKSTPSAYPLRQPASPSTYTLKELDSAFGQASRVGTRPHRRPGASGFLIKLK